MNKTLLNEFTKKGSIQISEENGSTLLKPIFVANRFNIGIFSFALMGIFFIAIAFLGSIESFEFWIMISLGTLLLIAFSVTIIKHLSDFLLITDKEIIYRNSFKTGRFALESALKIKVKGKKRRTSLKRQSFSSYAIDIFIKKNGRKYRIFDFLTEGRNKSEAIAYGKALKKFILRKLKRLN